MDDQNAIEHDSEVADQRSHRLARFIHERKRPRQDRAVPVEIEFGYLGTNPGGFLEPGLMALSKSRHGVAAKVVPRTLVALARVAQPDDECR